jgi:alanine dehydrogenase
MKIAILRETKTPQDRRVPLTPLHCREILQQYPDIELVVQPSDLRCFSNQEYTSQGIMLQEDLSDCNLLMGVKEVNNSELMPGKSYMFFSHTAKEQPYNRNLLKAIVNKKITLIDYEYLTRSDNTRVVAFGKWAGIVGTYNGLKAYGLRKGLFQLEPAWKLSGLEEMKELLKDLKINAVKIILTGGGRVAHGAMEILKAAGIQEVSPLRFLKGKAKNAVFSRLDPWHYTRHVGGKEFEFSHFVEHPTEYENTFLPYAKLASIYIACHFWDPDSPILLSKKDLQESTIKIQVIADISCDINGPIASTIRASTIADPVYGYKPVEGVETLNPYDKDAITVMAVDNLPGELPRDASENFGSALIENVIPYLLNDDSEGILGRATIVKNGALSEKFSYLKDYLNG